MNYNLEKKVIERSDLQPPDMIDCLGASFLLTSLMIGTEKQVGSSQIHMYGFYAVLEFQETYLPDSFQKSMFFCLPDHSLTPRIQPCHHGHCLN